MERGLTVPGPVELGDGVGTEMKLPGKRLSGEDLPADELSIGKVTRMELVIPGRVLDAALGSAAPGLVHHKEYPGELRKRDLFTRGLRPELPCLIGSVQAVL